MPFSLVRSRVGRAVLVAAFAGLVVPAAGCRGWRGAGDTYFAHRVPAKRARKEATFGFGQPGTAWRPVRSLSDVQVAWVRPDIAGIIELHAQCDEQGDSDLEQYTDHLRIDWTDWSMQSQSDERLIGRAALRTVATGKLDGIAMQQELWVVKRSGCLFDLRYGAPPATFAQGQSDFSNVVRGLSFPL